VILMDFEMPNLNGPDATRKLRELGCSCLIVGVTGNVLPEDVAIFINSGADAVMSKPLQTHRLEHMLYLLSDVHNPCKPPPVRYSSPPNSLRIGTSSPATSPPPVGASAAPGSPKAAPAPARSPSPGIYETVSPHALALAHAGESSGHSNPSPSTGAWSSSGVSHAALEAMKTAALDSSILAFAPPRTILKRAKNRRKTSNGKVVPSS
jgi:CheY-like chemotaxis protein